MATYFENFPLITYSLSETDSTANDIVTNIFRRVGFIAAMKNNAQMFYPYTIADGDLPEIISHKLYGDPNLYWVVTLFNDILDPILDWPKSYAQFEQYISDKYGSVSTAKITTQMYTKTITKISSQGFSSEDTYPIDLDTYNSLTSVVPEVYSFADGSTVTISTTRNSITVYDYEQQINESKRNIHLLKVEYIPLVRAQMKSLSA
jgi:hypothetical protein